MYVPNTVKGIVEYDVEINDVFDIVLLFICDIGFNDVFYIVLLFICNG